jgi:hypothetical protein
VAEEAEEAVEAVVVVVARLGRRRSLVGEVRDRYLGNVSDGEFAGPRKFAATRDTSGTPP